MATSNKLSTATMPEHKPTLYYAGFGYLGRFDNIAQKFPYAYQINAKKDKGLSQFNRLLINEVKQADFEHFKVSFDLVDQNKQQAIMLALSLERESLAYGPANTPFAEASGQLIVFDYNSMTFINSVQIALASGGLNAKEDPKTLFEQLYLVDPGMIKIGMQELKSMAVTPPKGAKFAVTNVSLTEAVVKKLPPQVPVIVLEEYIGQLLSAKMGSEGLNVIPYVKGATLGGQMVLRMADTTAYNLRLPEPDYAINIDVLSMDRFSDKHFNYYGIFMNLRVIEQASGKVLLDIDIINKEENRRNDKIVLKDTWAPMEDAFEMLLISLSSQLKKPHKKWCKEHCLEPKDFGKFRQFSKLINKNL